MLVPYAYPITLLREDKPTFTKDRSEHFELLSYLKYLLFYREGILLPLDLFIQEGGAYLIIQLTFRSYKKSLT